MNTSRALQAELEALHSHPKAHRPTLQLVAEVIDAHRGQRVVIGAGHAKRERQQQAMALDSAGGGRSDPRQIAARLGVSESSARRYLKGFKK